MYETNYNFKIIKYCLFILFLLFGLFSCYYEIEPIEYTGPQFPLTEDGRNILTFNYNDTLWVNESNSRDDIKCILYLNANSNYTVSINAYSRFEKYNAIRFSFLVDKNFKQIKEDSITKVILSQYGFDVCSDFTPITNDIIVNLIKLDTIERILAGEMIIPILINNCNETVVITKARFDVTHFNY